MQTDGIKWCMVNGGLTSNRMVTHPSSFALDKGLRPTAETFHVTAPDGSVFTVTVTKVKDAPED